MLKKLVMQPAYLLLHAWNRDLSVHQAQPVFDLKPVSCEGHGGFKLLDLELEKLRHVRVLTSIIKTSIYCSSTSHRCRMGDPGVRFFLADNLVTGEVRRLPGLDDSVSVLAQEQEET